ncbi:MAG: adenosylcobinamide-phosphate synthase [Gammaproteobacteria bacterium]|jgi:adenosylcobinamide-phosphate synthase
MRNDDYAMMITTAILLAIALDFIFGEARRFHPLVGFGILLDRLETRFNLGSARVGRGIVAWVVAVLPITALFLVIDLVFKTSPWLDVIWSAAVLYVALGWRSLMQHAERVIEPLAAGDLLGARKAVSHIVSRDSAALDDAGVARAATESVLENGADAIFAALFWFALFGVPGVVLYRLSNTLDAMWGYKNDRYRQFGWAAARIDDVMNFIPAQLTALVYALLGDRRQALHCWKTQGLKWKSPNAGPVMAAGAGALNLTLGGSETYHGELQYRSVLGPEDSPQTRASADGLRRACRMVNLSLLLWVATIALVEVLATWTR